MEKGQGNGTDTLQTNNVFTRKEYIEREAIIAILSQMANVTSHDYSAGISVAIDAIEIFPAADVVPVRHGRWIQYGAMKWYCSKCGLTIEAEAESLPNFCKDCGARMDGDGE